MKTVSRVAEIFVETFLEAIEIHKIREIKDP